MRPCVVALRHFLMHDAAAGRHPLHVAGTEIAAVAQAVAVLDGSGQHVGDGLDAAVRVPGEAGEILVRPVVAEIVEQQERIEFGGVAKAKGAAQMNARALDGGLRGDDAFDGSNGHGGFLDDLYADFFAGFLREKSMATILLFCRKISNRRTETRRHTSDTGGRRYRSQAAPLPLEDQLWSGTTSSNLV